MYPNTLRIAAAAIAVLTIASTADARRGGLICGATAMHRHGITDPQFRLAKNWARLLPHTNAHEGAVVVQHRKGRDSAGNPGAHVSTIVAMRGNCHALVADEKGQYERDICKGLIAYVDANGNKVAKAETAHHQYSAKRKHRQEVVQSEFVPVDRLMIH